MRVIVENKFGVTVTVEWDPSDPVSEAVMEKFATSIAGSIGSISGPLGVLSQGVIERLERLEGIERGTVPRST